MQKDSEIAPANYQESEFKPGNILKGSLFRQHPFLAIILVMAFLVMMLPFLPIITIEKVGLMATFGRFHPLLLHFPIVLVLFSVGFEILEWIKPVYAIFSKLKWLRPVLHTFTLFCILTTVISGFLLYKSGEYQGQMVEKHLWGGIYLILFFTIGWFFTLFQPKVTSGYFKMATKLGFLFAGFYLLFTSHIGGSITHGPDFLSETLPHLIPLEKSDIENKEREELIVFQDLIMPVFQKKCLSCHNDYKTKGGLLMTSFSSIVKGGKSEKPGFVSGKPGDSEIFHRITLPANHDDKMPPSEKPPLNEIETQILKWWISSGADPEMLLGNGPEDTLTQRAMAQYLPELFKAESIKLKHKKEREALTKELSKVGDRLGVVIEPDTFSDGNYYSVSMKLPPEFVDNKTIRELMPYAELISKLSLPGAEITDDALYDISQMTHLQALLLPKTCIKGDGLVYLKELKELTTLNLSHAFLNNEGMLHLIQLPQIQEIYIFGTDVDPLIVEALKSHLPQLKILDEEGPYF